MTSSFFSKQNRSPRPAPPVPCLCAAAPVPVGEAGAELLARCRMCCPRVLSCTGGLTWKPGGWLCGDSVIAFELSRGSSFICHRFHCEGHFMPREFLAFNPEICHKMLFANLLTSISFFFCINFFFFLNLG